jgi:hypothetical protein
MKRPLIIVIPIVLLVLINACESDRLPQFSPTQWAAIAKTQQVTALPENDRLKYWLNAQPVDYDSIDSLEESLVGQYKITSVDYPNLYYLEVYMNCECVSGSSCCNPEHMLVLTLQRMNNPAIQEQILAQVDKSVQYMNLVCTDRNVPFALMTVPWDKVKDFLYEQITGKELAPFVTRRPM